MMGLPSINWSKFDVPLDKRLSKEAVLMIVLHGFYRFGNSIATIFIQLYLWRLTEDLWINGIYMVILFCAGSLVYMVGGKIAKSKSPLVSYRLGIMMSGFFFLSILTAGESMVDFYYIFAVLNAFSSLYWLGFLSLVYDTSTERNRFRFIGINTIVFQLSGMIGPVFSGIIIARSEGLSGYTTVFIIAFMMYVITAIGSLYIKVETSHHKTYYLRLMGLVFKKNKMLLKTLCGWFVIGLLQGAMIFLPNILLLTTLGQEDLVGYVNVLFLSIAIITSYVMSQAAVADRSRQYITFAVWGTLLASSFLFWDIAVWTVVIMMVLFHIFNTIQMVTFDAYHYGMIAQLPLRGNLKIETVVGREVFINCGRILGIFMLILFAADISSPLLPFIVFFLALLQISLMWLVADARKAA